MRTLGIVKKKIVQLGIQMWKVFLDGPLGDAVGKAWDEAPLLGKGGKTRSFQKEHLNRKFCVKDELI